jgi:hypothetical protein
MVILLLWLIVSVQQGSRSELARFCLTFFGGLV